MKLYNQGQRSIIVNKKDMLSGDARPKKDGINDTMAYFAPNTKADFTPECAKMLLEKYPKEVIKWGE